ncbi:MAG: hypothetical protein ACK4MQ_03200 [Hyphomonas sp.]
MRSLLLASTLIAIAFSASALPGAAEAAAGSAPTGWTMRTFDIYDRDDLRKPVEERRVDYSGVIVHTADASQPGALFSCSKEKGLSVMYSFAPVDFADTDYFTSSNQVRGMGGRLIVDGERPRNAHRFLYRGKLNVAQTASADIAYDTIDALYAGKEIAVEVGGLKPVAISLPDPDDTFRSFVAACPAFASE